MQIVATVVGVEEGGRTPGKKAVEKGKQRTRGGSAGRKTTAKGQLQRGVQSDRGQGVKATREPGGEGQGGPGAPQQGGVRGDRKNKIKAGVLSVAQKYPMGQGPGWNNKQADTNATEGYGWDAKTSPITSPDA